MVKHDLHKLVGRIITQNFEGKAELDFDCSEDIQPKQRLPLFSSVKSKDNSRKTQLCYVDILIVSEDKVKVVIEIEESGMIPTKICGKFLTTGLAKSYSKEKVIPLADHLLFIQILNTKDIPAKSSLEPQWKNIEQGIKSISVVNRRRVDYVLIAGSSLEKDEDYFENKGKAQLIDVINKFLKTGEI